MKMGDTAPRGSRLTIYPTALSEMPTTATLLLLT
jgi:hypothetical protein